MNIYLIKRTTHCGWDEFDSAVVIAANEADAKTIHPDGDKVVTEKPEHGYCGTWVPLSQVTAELVGKAMRGLKRGVVCASFRAG